MPLRFDKRERDERRAGKSHTCEYCDSPECKGTCAAAKKHRDGASVLDALESSRQAMRGREPEENTCSECGGRMTTADGGWKCSKCGKEPKTAAGVMQQTQQQVNKELNPQQAQPAYTAPANTPVPATVPRNGLPGMQGNPAVPGEQYNAQGTPTFVPPTPASRAQNAQEQLGMPGQSPANRALEAEQALGIKSQQPGTPGFNAIPLQQKEQMNAELRGQTPAQQGKSTFGHVRWAPKRSMYDDDDMAVGEAMEHAASCPMCGGPGVPLGQLGRRSHFRCRNCGMDFSHEEQHPDDAAAHEQAHWEQDPEYLKHNFGKTADVSTPPEEGWQQKPTADPYNPAAYESLVGGGEGSSHGNVGQEAYKWAVQEGATPQAAAEQARSKEQAALHQSLQGQHPTNMYQVQGSWVTDSEIQRAPRLLS